MKQPHLTTGDIITFLAGWLVAISLPLLDIAQELGDSGNPGFEFDEVFKGFVAGTISSTIIYFVAMARKTQA